MSILEGLEITIFSMLLVFTVLVCIALIINIQTFILRDKKKEIKADKSDLKVIEKPEVIEEQDNELEIVAAIMAALSTCSDVPSDRLQIKSIRRLNNGSNWRDTAIKSSLK
ncbi:OadG family protein [Haloimpatiens sp. FM7330]|uniref:OadG family protein n=1 Tax=Haloimpatiens sp. FM7330 TaxID=3298610 RepID=UPI00363E3364